MSKPKITIITQSSCPHCEEIKVWLSERGYTFTVVPMEDQGGTALRRFLKGQDITTVPAVFWDGKWIGGCVATQWWVENVYETGKDTGSLFLNKE